MKRPLRPCCGMATCGAAGDGRAGDPIRRLHRRRSRPSLKTVDRRQTSVRKSRKKVIFHHPLFIIHHGNSGSGSLSFKAKKKKKSIVELLMMKKISIRGFHLECSARHRCRIGQGTKEDRNPLGGTLSSSVFHLGRADNN